MTNKKTVWAYFYMPILFLIIGYGTLYIILSPVLQVISSSVDVILLNEAPSFAEQTDSIFSEATNNNKQPQQKVIPSSEIDYPPVGTEYGQVIIDKVKIKSKLTIGDRPEDLRTGVGQFTGGAFPGETGTTLIGGHNTTDFNTINLVEADDTVTINTHYGTYLYKITDKKVARFDDRKAIQSLYDEPEGHKLILYTCYPIDMIGLTDDRLFVYADLVEGPLIDLDN